MLITVSSIKRPLLRRAAIVGSYPFLAVGVVFALAWNAVVDLFVWQIDLAKSARKEW